MSTCFGTFCEFQTKPIVGSLYSPGESLYFYVRSEALADKRTTSLGKSSLRGAPRAQKDRHSNPLSMEPAMLRMRAVQVSSANGPFELVLRDIPTPGPRQVRIKVQEAYERMMSGKARFRVALTTDSNDRAKTGRPS
jgi:hypothetical protein